MFGSSDELWTCKDWKHIGNKMKKHVNSVDHIAHVKSLVSTLGNQNRMADAFRVSVAARDAARLENRRYLATIIDCTTLLMTQGLAFRGHDESTTSRNRGNFLALISFVSKHSESMKKRCEEGQRNANYQSASIQNDLISVIGDLTVKTVVAEIMEAGYFSIMLDETTDIANKEQVSLCFRYTHRATGVATERVLQMKSVAKADAVTLKRYICDFLRKVGLSMNMIVGQSYDGASVMQGAYNGLAAKIRDIVAHAVSTWCSAHRLALVVEDACLDCSYIVNAFSLLTMIYNYFSASGKRYAIWERVFAEEERKGVKSWQLLSGTRWYARSSNCSAFVANLDILYTTFDDPELAQDEKKIEIMNYIEDFKTMVTIFLIEPILLEVNCASQFLQSKSKDIGTVTQHIVFLKKRMEFYRDTEEKVLFNQQYQAAVDMCTLQGIAVEPPPRRVRRRPIHLEGAADTPGMQADVRAPADTLSYKDNFYKKMWLPFLTKICSMLDARFGDDAIKLGVAVGAFSNFDNADPTTYEYFLNLYPDLRDNMHMINTERKTWNTILKDFVAEATIEEDRVERMKLNKSVGDQLKHMCATKMDQHFTHMHRALTIATTIAFTSASCERSFSTLSYLKNSLRSTMTDERLTALIVGYCESDIVKRLKVEDILSLFSSNGSRRINI